MPRKKRKAEGEFIDTTQTEPTVGAFYRLFPRHVHWLAEMALRQKQARGSRGRADASEILRKVLDKAMAGQG